MMKVLDERAGQTKKKMRGEREKENRKEKAAEVKVLSGGQAAGSSALNHLHGCSAHV